MVPSRPSRLMAHDRAWRNLASRPISPQIFTKARPDAKDLFAPDASSAAIEAGSISEPNRDRAILPVAMMVMIGVSFGGVLGLAGWPMLQAFGLVKEPVIETVQRSQAELIARLDATVSDLSARIASTSDKQAAASQFMAEVDARFVAVRKSMRELRDAQNESWLAPVAELNAAATKARGDIVKLRASLDELRALRHPDAAAISARIDKIEQAMVQTRSPGAIRGSIHASAERPRSLASVASAERLSAADGFIFDLKPAQ